MSKFVFDLSEVKIEPFHQHDCESCVYLGSERLDFFEGDDVDYDFYFCPEDDGLPGSIIARYGENGDYSSGTGFAFSMPALNIAFQKCYIHFRDKKPWLFEAFKELMVKEYKMRFSGYSKTFIVTNAADFPYDEDIRVSWFKHFNIESRRFHPDFLPDAHLHTYFESDAEKTTHYDVELYKSYALTEKDMKWIAHQADLLTFLRKPEK